MNQETSQRTSPSVPEVSAGPAPAKEQGSRGSAIPPASTRVPKPKGASGLRRVIFASTATVIVVAVLLVLWRTGVLFAQAPFTGPTWTVTKEKLKLTIVARGNLESAKNSDIYCTVRSGNKGSTVATIIKWIIDEGTEVKKGDKLLELDSSGFQDQLKDKTKDVDNAYALKVAADENISIQKIGNESAIKAALNARDLAKIELEKYRDGDYVAALKDLEGKIETTKSDLEDWKDRAAWSARMVKKGLLSKVQADADKSRADASRITLENYEVQKKVLEKYTLKREIQDRKAKLDEAERTMRKAEIEARSNLALKEADRKTKESIYLQELARKRDIEAEIAKCTVVAPQDGLVVYYVPEQVRGGGGSQQSVVAQGEPVREGQKMIQIPDLTRMLVTVKVPEAFVANLHSADSKRTDNRQLAQIRVDSFSKESLKGHVLTVDTVASTQDWFASDVKVYKTKVAIHGRRPGLKPGMSAEVTIFADETPEPVLVVPVQSVLGTITSGEHRQCYVVLANGQTEKRDIEVGMSNERLVEVKSGLQEGDQVVLNPGPLAAKEGSELKPGKVRAKEDDSRGGDPGKGKSKGGSMAAPKSPAMKSSGGGKGL